MPCSSEDPGGRGGGGGGGGGGARRWMEKVGGWTEMCMYVRRMVRRCKCLEYVLIPLACKMAEIHSKCYNIDFK